jgi:Lon protease-like protein
MATSADSKSFLPEWSGGVDAVPTSMDQLGISVPPSSQEYEGSVTWLPIVSTNRPVLPFEHCSFQVRRAHVCDVLRLCWQRELPVASLVAPTAAQSLGTASALGTALRIEGFEEVNAAHVTIHAVGVQPFRVMSRGTLVHRHAASAPGLVNIAGVEWFEENRGEHSSTALVLRRQVMELLQAIQPASELQGEPASVAQFSWWAVSQLPLPPQARGFLLRVRDPTERLSICMAILRSAARLGTGLAGRRAKL